MILICFILPLLLSRDVVNVMTTPEFDGVEDGLYFGIRFLISNNSPSSSSDGLYMFAAINRSESVLFL